MLNFGIIASAGAAQAGITNWESFNPTGVDYQAIAFGNGTAVVQKMGASNALGYSTAITTSITAGGSVTTGDYGIYYNGGVWHIPGGVTDTHRVAYSLNGTSWATAINVGAQTGDNIETVAYNGSVWIAPVAGDNDVYTSTTGTAFTLQSGVLATNQWTDSTWNGSVFGVYAGRKYYDTGSTAYYTSTNGTTWTARTLPAIPVSPVAAGSGIVMYLGSSAVVYTSSSGTAFAVAGTAPQLLWQTNQAPSKLVFGNGVWVHAGKTLLGGTVLSYYSKDNGASWATATFGSAITTDSYDLAYDSNTNAFYILEDGGSVSVIYKASVTS